MTQQALLVIDVQNGMFQEGNAVYNGDQLLHHVNELLAKARSKNIPVIYVQHQEAAGEPLEYGTRDWEIHPDIAPAPDDIIIHKKTPDSFLHTPLDEELKKLGIEHVILTGIQSDLCVDTTCRRAFSMGYKVTLASDAHSTWGHEDMTAAQIIKHHNEVLRWFARVYPSEEIVF